MKSRTIFIASGVAHLLLTSFVLFSCLTLSSETARAQRPAPTPINIDDKSVGEPERVELEGGKYKLVYRNKDGQVIREEEFALGVPISTKNVLLVFPNGQEREVRTTYYRPDGEQQRRETIRYDKNGNARERTIVTFRPGRWKREKWNPNTQSWDPIPDNQVWSGKAEGEYVELRDFKFNPVTGDWDKTTASDTGPPSDGSDKRPARSPDNARLNRGSVDGNNRGTSASTGYEVANTVAGGLSVATFTTPQGTVYVNLPSDIAAGDTISGTVVAQPEGQDDKTRTRNQDELSKYVVEVLKQQTSSTNRVLNLSIPAAINRTYLTLKDKKGKEVARCEVSVVPVPPQATAENFGLPTIGQQSHPIEVTGAFDGDFRTTNLTLGGQRIEILAESPRILIARNTSDTFGVTQLVIEEQGRSATGEFRSIGLKLSAPKLDLLRGEQTTLTVTVLGLEGIKAPVPLVLENKSPGVISMGSTTMERISISPAQVQGGIYTTTRPLTGIQRGGFTIVGTVTRDGQ